VRCLTAAGLLQHQVLTQTWIGGALGDKMSRYALLIREQEPYIWDFGSAARHHRLFSPWLLPERSRPGLLGLRGAVAPDAGLIEGAVREIKGLLEDAGVAHLPVGLDITELPFIFEMQRQGLTVVDAQQRMLDAREIKSIDEILLLNTAAAMVDGVYRHISEQLKPGIRENDIVALASHMLYRLGSEQVEAINSVSGERRNPHPHNFSDRIIRPGDQAFFDIIHSYNGYRTCYYRTFVVGKPTAAQTDAYTRRGSGWMRQLRPCGLVSGPIGSLDCGRRRRILDSMARWRPSDCSSDTDSGSGCMNGRSSAGSTVWIIPSRSKRAWCSSWKPIAPQRMGSRLPGSRTRL